MMDSRVGGRSVLEENMVQARRRVVRAAMGVFVAGALVGSVAVAGAAESQPDATIKTTVQDTWSPANVSVQTGETVTWDFDGSVRSHNLDGETGPAADHELAQAARPTTSVSSGQVEYFFTQPGEYDFVCEAHPAMIGSVTVTGAPVTPTPTPTATATRTPTPTPTATPAPAATPTPTRRSPDARPGRHVARRHDRARDQQAVAEGGGARREGLLLAVGAGERSRSVSRRGSRP